MKNGKRPSVKQSKFIQANGLRSADWLVTKDTPDEMVLVHRYIPTTTRRLAK